MILRNLDTFVCGGFHGSVRSFLSLSLSPLSLPSVFPLLSSVILNKRAGALLQGVSTGSNRERMEERDPSEAARFVCLLESESGQEEVVSIRSLSRRVFKRIAARRRRFVHSLYPCARLCRCDPSLRRSFRRITLFCKRPREKKKKKRETKRRTKTTQNDFLSGIFIVLSAHLTPFKGLVGKCLRLRVLLVEPRNFGAVVWRNVCDGRGASLGRKLVVFYLSVQRLSGSAFARSRWVRSAQPAGCFFIRYGRSRSNSVRPIPTGVKSWS